MAKQPSLPSGEPGDDMAEENAEADAEEAAGGNRSAVDVHDDRLPTDGFDRARQIERAKGAEDEAEIERMREPARTAPTDFNHPATVEVSGRFCVQASNNDF